MIKINWAEVHAAKTKLFSDGETNSFEMVIIVLYYSKSECDRIQITLDQLEQALFDIGSNRDVKGVFLYDIDLKKPYLKCEEPDRANVLESVPNAGHPNVVKEFNEMTAEARDVWAKITIANVQHDVSQGM
jgi:hypothetical protein